ncbi:IFRD1 [Cordylochernes scorpioides]|uniref:IFRD1 n=1 Tax=Cordylochernes scorpioides TaxID=51811 RepID=A0ABY6LHP5_9ARAC|nr:IFRD1 [Cordylochernes scorpioides]
MLQWPPILAKVQPHQRVQVTKRGSGTFAMIIMQFDSALTNVAEPRLKRERERNEVTTKVFAGVGNRQDHPGSDEDSNMDNASVVSLATESRISSDDQLEMDGVDPDEPAVAPFYDDFEDKLKDAIDGTNQKSAKGRQNCLSAIHKALISRYLYDFLMERRATMADLLERCLRRGKGEEQGQAALLAALVCLHYGPGVESEALYSLLRPHLLTFLADPTMAPSTRGKCGMALSLLCFIIDSNSEELATVMEALHSVYSGSYLKGNGAPPTVSPDMAALHSSALLAWSLLVTTLTPSQLSTLNSTHFRRVPELLESTDLDLRIATGETLVVFYEMARLYDEDYEYHSEDRLVERLRVLATDCQKSRAKKDRRQQRASFRDVIRAIEDRESPDIKVKFGTEDLLINTWSRKRQYDSLCQLLGSGMNFHLTVSRVQTFLSSSSDVSFFQVNELLRDIFELGPPLPTKPSIMMPKVSKMQRHIANMAACKARTKSRQRLRDKRADVIR